MRHKNQTTFSFIFKAILCAALLIILIPALSSCTLAKKVVDSVIVEKDKVSYDTYPPGETDNIKTPDTSSDSKKDNSLNDSKETDAALIKNPEADFKTFTDSEPDYKKIFEFIDNNINSADTVLADEMIDFAIRYAEDNTEPFTDKFSAGGVQDKLWNDYSGETDLNVLKNLEDKQISDLAIETLERKYKILSVEGFIMPIVDYKAYEIYKDFMSSQMNNYLSIMSLESEKISVLDMGITISLDEYVGRIILIYQFKDKYPDFKNILEIKNMLSGKLWVYMGGIDNTPVFDFEGNIIEERLADFKANAEKYKGTEFGSRLKEYLDLLEKENYIKTQKVSDYIDSL